MAWLRGELRRISEVKRALIFQRIARHNARHMLASLAHWLRITGSSGLLLVLDIARCPLAVPREQRDDGVYYSRPRHVRRLRDAAPAHRRHGRRRAVRRCPGRPEFATDLRRSYVQYPALHYRLADEVHDRYRPNPLAALVRIGDA